MFFRVGIPKTLIISTEKHLCWRLSEHLSEHLNSGKRDFSIGTSCEICKILKNIFFYRTAPVVSYKIKLVFSWKSRIKTGVTVRDKYRIQLKKVLRYIKYIKEFYDILS